MTHTTSKRYAVPSSADAKSWARAQIRGQWCCLLMPVTSDDELDSDGLRQAVRHALQLDLGGLAYSSIMEPWSSTHAERKFGLEVFLDEVAGEKPVYVTITDHSIKETVSLGRHALDAGAAIALVNVPYEHAKTESQILGFFEYVSRSLDGPVGLYNTPHSGVILSPETVAQLAQLENVCVIKNAINDREHTRRLFELVGDVIVVNGADEGSYLDAIVEHGQQTLFSVTGTHLLQSPAWQPIEEYARLARSGDVDGARRIAAAIEPLRAIREDLYRVLWGGGRAEHPIAYIKYWQELMGMPAGPPRPPIADIDADAKRAFRRRLAETGLMERLRIELPDDGAGGARGA